MESLTECTVESVGLSLQLKGEKKKKKPCSQYFKLGQPL